MLNQNPIRGTKMISAIKYSFFIALDLMEFYKSLKTYCKFIK